MEWHYGMLQRWIKGRLPARARGMADTADIVQDVFLRVLQEGHLPEPDHKGAFQGYLRMMAMNRIHDEIRRGRR